MATINIDDYFKLSVDKDLETSLIELKLNALTQGIPDFAQKELYPCFSSAYTTIVRAITEGNTAERVDYYTQNEQPEQFHSLAFPLFNIIVAYAGNLGRLIQAEKRLELLPSIIAVGQKVFKNSDYKKTDHIDNKYQFHYPIA